MFDTPEQARAYILAHDEDCKVLNRKPKYELAAIETSELAAQGMTRLYGGPFSKDELISSILDLRFPRVAEARKVYYARLAG